MPMSLKCSAVMIIDISVEIAFFFKIKKNQNCNIRHSLNDFPGQRRSDLSRQTIMHRWIDVRHGAQQ